MSKPTPMQKKETGNAKARAYFSPACFKMDAYVLRSRSPPCIGTVSFPGFVGCTICRCEPFCAFFSQPSAFRICRISFAVTLSPPVFIITRIMRIVNICCKYKCKLSMYSAALLILAGRRFLGLFFPQGDHPAAPFSCSCASWKSFTSPQVMVARSSGASAFSAAAAANCRIYSTSFSRSPLSI